MGKRSRARGRAEKLTAPTSEYRSGGGDVLTLRGALTPKTRREYHAPSRSVSVRGGVSEILARTVAS